VAVLHHRITFKGRYFFCFIALFAIEVVIALFIRDGLIRPYGGDFLVVIFLYCLVRSILRITPIVTGLSVLLFSYLVELLQFFDTAHFLGFSTSPVMMTLFGSFFSWEDIVAYTAGVAIAVSMDAVVYRFLKQESVPRNRGNP